jgi:hypothetical protein
VEAGGPVVVRGNDIAILAMNAHVARRIRETDGANLLNSLPIGQVDHDQAGVTRGKEGEVAVDLDRTRMNCVQRNESDGSGWLRRRATARGGDCRNG